MCTALLHNVMGALCVSLVMPIGRAHIETRTRDRFQSEEVCSETDDDVINRPLDTPLDRSDTQTTGNPAPEDRVVLPEYPRKDDFSESVPSVAAVDASSALSGPRIGCDHARTDDEGDTTSDRSGGDSP